ncbi:hypothetical protein LUZ63_022325 [Rhynchospora breviuscula]|uniref:Uncharacterized protein ycf68 n=1 Tax=Rhynchospora breviuscula TaxID=2022672 RepID=A0A9Q0BXT8_9POAL|nr:hypothetical protein LUZ63_022325 [Rhynchospora breviuscula]
MDGTKVAITRAIPRGPPIGIGGPTRRAISSAVERAPDNCHGVLFLFESEFETKLLLRRIDGAIQVRSNVDLTFYSLVGPGRSGGDHHGSSLLENPYTPYQSPNNASSQTKNYEIAPFILGCDDLLHGRGLWFKSRMAQLRQGKESKKHLTLSCILHSGDIAQLVELRSCNWVVAITLDV